MCEPGKHQRERSVQETASQLSASCSDTAHVSYTTCSADYSNLHSQIQKVPNPSFYLISLSSVVRVKEMGERKRGFSSLLSRAYVASGLCGSCQ